MLAFNFFKPSWALLSILHVCMSLLLADAVDQNLEKRGKTTNVDQIAYWLHVYFEFISYIFKIEHFIKSASPLSPAGLVNDILVVNQPVCQYTFEIRPNTSAIDNVSRVYSLCAGPRGPMFCDIFSSIMVDLQKRGLSRGQSELLENDLTNDDPPQLQWEEEVSEEGSARKRLQNELHGQESNWPGEPCRLDPMKLDPGFDRLQAMIISEEMLLRMSMLEDPELIYKLGITARHQIYKQIWDLYKDVLNWICDLKCQRPKTDEKEVSSRPNALGQLEATNMSQNCQFEGRLRMEKNLRKADSGRSRLGMIIQLSDQPGDIVHMPLVLGLPFLKLVVQYNERFTGLKSTSANISCHKRGRSV
ncbi:unnamed protein product [Protopolystoma xenopodis]|uniref:Uncharacterized protein n=1 Tax=Protopolystoma xenopodis TaxID=117903 RepID=A0A3S5B2I5_9PLAT|nr:unnamed protein product [Protopolystoma xenopodis]